MDSAPIQPRDGIELISAADISCSPVDWIWPKWLARGKLHLLVGEPEAGKTTLAMMFAAMVSAGGTFPSGDQAANGKVVIWSGEDDAADTLVPRLVAAGVDRSRVLFIGPHRRNGKCTPFNPAKDMDALVQAIEDQGEVALLILDPVVSAITGDSHSNTEVRRGLQPIVDLADRTGIAVLGITHLAKGSAGRDPTQRVIGSIAFAATARVVMVTGKGPNGSVLIQTKNNLSARPDGYEYTIEPAEAEGVSTSVIRWGSRVSGSARELLGGIEADNEIGHSALSTAVTWLQEHLQDGPVLTRELQAEAEDNGIAKRTLERAKSVLKIQPRRTPDGWVCRLPPGTSSPPTSPTSPTTEAE